jgi:hypothetical protein
MSTPTPAALPQAPLPTQSQAMASLPGCSQAKLNEFWSLGLLSPGDLDVRTLAELAKLPEHAQLTALDAIGKSNTSIVNKSGFFMGIITKIRTRSQQLAALDAMGVNPGTGILNPASQQKLDFLYNTGQILKSDLDQAILESLGQFDAQTQCSIMDTFMGKNLASITNKSGYMAGIMKRYRQDAAQTRQLQSMYSVPATQYPMAYAMPASAPSQQAQYTAQLQQYLQLQQLHQHLQQMGVPPPPP